MDRSVSRLRAPHAALLVLFAVVAFAGGAGDAQAIPQCGNNQCEAPFENVNNCPVDCGGFCGDNVCSATIGESCATCPGDCGNSCITLEISSELKKPFCDGDDDNDCLDNFEEQDLAWLFSPHYFYDEDEGCSGAWYTQGGAQTHHFGRRDFYQVRPDGAPQQWQADGAIKEVDITYFLLHPHDCRWDGGFAGHQGDSESVVFHLVSTDLKRWTLTGADFRHHGYTQQFSGGYLKQRANEIGTIYPSVAADQNSHGSWPGRVGWDTDCAGSEDDLCFGTCDCFRGTMQSAKASNFREFPPTFRNVGGPPPETWRPQTVSVGGNEAFTVFDVGHGSNVEFWTPRTDAFKTFCGWECPQRTSGGDCVLEVHGRRTCTPGGLAEKVDGSAFTPPQGPVLLPVDPKYDPVIAGWLQQEVGSLVLALSYLPTVEIEYWLGLLRDEIDPIGVVAPQVAGRPLDRQHQTLSWILQVQPEKYEAALAPGLLPADGLTREEIDHAAREFLTGLVDRLRQVIE